MDIMTSIPLAGATGVVLAKAADAAALATPAPPPSPVPRCLGMAAACR